MCFHFKCTIRVASYFSYHRFSWRILSPSEAEILIGCISNGPFGFDAVFLCDELELETKSDEAIGHFPTMIGDSLDDGNKARPNDDAG